MIDLFDCVVLWRVWEETRKVFEHTLKSRWVEDFANSFRMKLWASPTSWNCSFKAFPNEISVILAFRAFELFERLTEVCITKFAMQTVCTKLNKPNSVNWVDYTRRGFLLTLAFCRVQPRCGSTRPVLHTCMKAWNWFQNQLILLITFCKFRIF